MHISHMMLYCRDQDEARDFYVEKLGFEVESDVEFGENYRWLALHLPGQDLNVVLMPPDAGPHPPEIVDRIRELLALGGMMGGIINTDDCRRDYEALRERGVEFSEEPEERFYGIDCGFRDPSGNPWRLTQPAEVVAPPDVQKA
jgi:catechol 2,3-dioxygenase-like lactoylglutathione lyase family enzyme